MEENGGIRQSVNGAAGASNSVANGSGRRLTDDEFERYSRQMIVPGMGKEGQLRLINSRVLIIGAGGLGCPAAQYIAGAGVGTIGIIDGDVVEASNLHRQVGHSTSRIGMKKVDSLIAHLKALNPLPTYVPYPFRLTPQNAADIISKYDLILDCTDNPVTRYLISDVCVLVCKPLVTAAAIQKSGQLTVLNCPPTPQGLVDGKYAPCYRCCFRKPPPPSSMVSCGEAGIMGPVVGMMGVAQAGEAIKILASALHIPAEAGGGDSSNTERNLQQPTLLIYTYDLESAVGPYTFRALKMGGRKRNCFACGENSTLTLEGIKAGTPDYVQFCSAPAPAVSLPPEERITAAAYHAAREKGELPEHILIDTREKEHFSFGSIEGAINVPFGKFLMKAAAIKRDGGPASEILPADAATSDKPIFVVCRTGADSQETVEKLKELGLDRGGKRRIVDIVGGMKAWKQEVDPTFPYI
ncbi:hypothetical protein MYCTH_2295614 [Thermothelomyces thermophilus ATCC 42464]|uniref:Adenylyltransferase and sulfurtransferase uba4 n=1 Tax=Thermothelomyces thermophilus (strain ATCC 42464 / BCRC 31852 / DSM 1799) TaxID=573729 RepID=G2Q5S4_THET4|nr:uncharacterized protein MYCTH_2295614 [Thermothelomyces thermophilus ATCC 42464]AEO53800.1 hypothetical protein MYCTH_2295614 [Thermothelomyces thermophilus ATCC 42464]